MPNDDTPNLPATNTQGTALTAAPTGAVTAYDFAPRTLEEAMKLADMLANSSMVPKDFQGKPGNCFIAMQMGAELGLKPVAALQSIAVVNGRPSVWGDSLLGLVLASGVCDYVREPEPTMDEGVCIVKRKGQAEVTRRFTKEDAERAHLLQKDIWKQYRPRMLQMRARAFALRDVFPDVLKGMPIAEEVRDYNEPERDVTQHSSVEVTSAATATSDASKSARVVAGLVKKTVKAEEVIKAFADAKDKPELAAAVELAKKLEGTEPEKVAANAAYHEAKKRIVPPSGPTVDDVRGKLKAAKTADDVDLAASLIDALPVEADVKAALHADAKTLRNDLTKE